MENLFYCDKTKTFAWVAGYVWEPSNVLEFVGSLTKHATEFSKFANVDLNKVESKFIESSSRYKYMRVFYCNVDENFKIPENTYQLKNYNIWDWLRD